MNDLATAHSPGYQFNVDDSIQRRGRIEELLKQLHYELSAGAHFCFMHAELAVFNCLDRAQVIRDEIEGVRNGAPL